jgi:hypothetical protein
VVAIPFNLARQTSAAGGGERESRRLDAFKRGFAPGRATR